MNNKNLLYRFNRSTCFRVLFSILAVGTFVLIFVLNLFITSSVVKPTGEIDWEAMLRFIAVIILSFLFVTTVVLNRKLNIYENGFTDPITTLSYLFVKEGDFISFDSIDYVEHYAFIRDRVEVMKVYLKNGDVIYISQDIGKVAFNTLLKIFREKGIVVKKLTKK